jgi:antitoxin component HigA of HigAB toxin-antitoxin module
MERPEQAEQLLAGLAGKVVGFIDNAKPNFNYLVDDLAELLTSKHGVTRVLKRQKRSASVPAPDEVIKEFAEQCDLVITGSGD